MAPEPKTISSAARELSQRQKETAARARKQAEKARAAELKAHNRRMNPERLLSPDQEARCKGVVTRALKKLGLKPADFPSDALTDLQGMVRGMHPHTLNFTSMHSGVEYGRWHARYFAAWVEGRGSGGLYPKIAKKKYGIIPAIVEESEITFKGSKR